MGLRDNIDNTDPYQVRSAAMSFDNEDLVRRVKMVIRHMPLLRKAPTFAMQMAQLPVPDDHLMSAVRNSDNWNRGRQVRTAIQSMDPAKQRRIWNRTDSEQRALLRQTGYRPPDEDDSGGNGLFGIGKIPVVGDVLMSNTTDKLLGNVPFVGGAIAAARGDLHAAAARGIPGVGGLAENIPSGVGPGLTKGIGTGLDAATSALPAPIEGPTRAAGHAIGVGLHGMNVFGAAPAHGYRFLRVFMGGDDPGAGWGYGFNPDDWHWGSIGDIWEETGARNGEGYFPEAVHNEVARTLKDDKPAQRWAYRLASGDEVDDIAAEFGKRGSNDYNQAYFRIANRVGDPDFQSALKTYGINHVSFGRNLARGFGLHEGTDVYNAVSGGLDLAFTVYMDPMLIAGKAMKGYRLARLGIAVADAGEGIRDLRYAEETKLATALGSDWAERVQGMSTRQLLQMKAPFTAFAEKIAKPFREKAFFDAAGNLVSDPAIADLMKNMPSARRAVDTLRKWDTQLRTNHVDALQKAMGRTLSADELAQVPGIRSADDIWNLYDDSLGKMALIEGQFGGFTKDWIELPRLTWQGQANSQVKLALEKAIDFGREGRRLDVNLAPGDVQLKPGQAPVAVPDAIPAPKEGLQRLYRVQNGNQPLHAPDYLDPVVAERMGIENWWTDDLGHARAVVQAYGPTAQLHVLDVAPDEVKVLGHEDIPFLGASEQGYRASLPGQEFQVTSNTALARVRNVGTVGSWVEVQKGGALEHAAQWLLAPPSNLLFSMTHRVPETQTIALFGASFVDEVQRLLDMGLSSTARQRWMNDLMTTANSASRRSMLRATMDHMFAVNGVYQTPEGIEMAQRYLNGTKMAYARDGLDRMFVGGNSMRVGIAPKADFADGIAIPGFRDVIAQSQRASLTRRVFGGINSNMVDSFMGTYWKPSVLLRLGFIPRAAGEEFLSTILRFPGIIKDNWVLRPLAAKEGEPLWLFDRVAGGVNYANHFIDGGSTHIDRLADWIARAPSGWVRGMAAQALDPGELRAARAMAEHGYIQKAYMERLPAVTGQHNVFASEIPGKDDYYSIPINAEGTEQLKIKNIGSEYADYIKGESHEYHGMLAHEVNRTVRDQVMAEAMHAGNVYFDPEDTALLAQSVRRAAAETPEVGAQIASDLRRIGDPTWTPEVVGEMRYALSVNKKLRGHLERYEELARGPAEANDAYLAFKDALNVASTPAERIATYAFPHMSVRLRESMLADEERLMRHLGAVEADDTENMIRHVSALPNPDEGKVRFWISAHDHPSDLHRNEMYLWETPEQALAQSFDGAEAGTGFKLWYADFDREEYITRQLAEQGIIPPEELDVLPEVPTATLGLTTVNEDVLNRMREVRGFQVASPFQPEHAEEIRGLIVDARNGSKIARDELQRRAARQGLDNLANHTSTAHLVRENERSYFNLDGRAIQVPVAEGNARRYVIVANERGHEALANYVAGDETLTKSVLAPDMMIDPEAVTALRVDADQWGTSPYRMVSKWSTSSQSEAERVMRQMAVDHPNDFALATIDVPADRLSTINTDGVPIDMLHAWRPADETIGPSRASVTAELRSARVEQEAALAEYDRIARGRDLTQASDRATTAEEVIAANPEMSPETQDFLRSLPPGHPLLDPGNPELDEAAANLERANEHLRTLGFDPDSLDDEVRLRGILAPLPAVDEYSQRLDDWASVIAAKVNQLSTSPIDGRYLHEIGGRAARQGSFDIRDVSWSGLEEQHLPAGVTGPKKIPDEGNLWDKVVRTSFEQINKAIGAIAREPLFFKNFSKRFAYAESMLRPHFEDPEAVAAMLDVAKVVPGRQSDALRTFRSVWQQLGDLDQGLVRAPSWIEADYEQRLAAALERIDVPGIKPQMLADVKSVFSSMSGNDIGVVRKWAENQQRLSEVATKSALEGAVFDTVPFIDDHKIRSQYAEYMRNLTPFHFAEEQMLKRWARVLVHSPEAIRRAQLLYMGLSHSGIIRQNQFGDDVWTMPGSAQLTAALGKGLGAVLGEDYTIPVAVPFTGEVKYTLPGLNRVGAPSFSPLVGIPMTMLSRRFPELNQVNSDVLGEQAAGRSFVDQIVPTSVKRVYSAIFDRPDTSAQYSSAMIQAMQYMEANNLTPERADFDSEYQFRRAQKDYIERVRHWTRTMLISRAVLGFMSPAPPQAEIPGNLNAELQGYLRNMDYEDAIATFMKRHPDATAYTVFGTESASGASMPTTREVGAFLDNNVDFVKNHSLATPWLLPQKGTEDSTSRQVYATQVRLELRNRKSPEHWLEDVEFAEASEDYFAMKDGVDRIRLTVADDKAKKTAVDDYWAKWKQQYFKMHPTFEQQIASPEAHNRRINVLNDVRAALNDPNRPEIEEEDNLRILTEGYFMFKKSMDSLKGDRTNAASDQRSRIRVGFSEWGKRIIAQNPSVAAFWHRNIEQELGLTAEEKFSLEE